MSVVSWQGQQDRALGWEMEFEVSRVPCQWQNMSKSRQASQMSKFMAVCGGVIAELRFSRMSPRLASPMEGPSYCALCFLLLD